MAECGTTAGYHSHWREAKKTTGVGSVECEECRAAMAEDKQNQRQNAIAQAAADFEDALNSEPEIEPGIDVLKELRHAARTTRAAMRVPKSTRDIASLAKQYAELVQMIAELEAEQDKSGGVLGGFDDELAGILRPDFSGRNTGT
jgi:hypothetical protein